MKKKVIVITTALIIFLIAMFVKFNNELINKTLFAISYIIVGFEVLKEAVKNILKGEVFDENFLMAIATIGAFAIGEFPEAVAVMLFYQIGEAFQDYGSNRARKSIASLMDIRPDFANLYQDGKEKKIDPQNVNIGDTIIVKPGEKIPLDGNIIEGKSSIDTKALTGESLPQDVQIGDTVLSGCINLSGVIKIKVSKAFGQSTVSKILNLVENASEKKAKSENFITKFAKIYTPIVVGIAILFAIIPPLIIKDASFSDWIYRALSFLVVSCPCALVISIPLSFFGGIGGASRKGVLIKGSNYLEALSNAETVVFDKTGTLTEGVFEVQKINAVIISKEELLEIVAFAENYSNHPISSSIKKAYGKEIQEKQIENVKELTGRGIEVKIKGKDVLVGNEKLMNERNIEFERCEDIGTILYVAIENRFAGSIVISDQIKEDSKRAIKELKKNGVKNTVMLTGDKRKVGEYVANKLGIDRVYTELLPDGKVKEVERLLKEKSGKGKLVFVGDGINDAPVLATSDIGIAMGALGSDAAIEAADVVIMADEISKIVDAIHISRKTMRIVKENIIFAIGIKVLMLILSAVGVSTMWGAVFADVGVSIIAVINALRALNNKF